MNVIYALNFYMSSRFIWDLKRNYCEHRGKSCRMPVNIGYTTLNIFISKLG